MDSTNDRRHVLVAPSRLRQRISRLRIQPDEVLYRAGELLHPQGLRERIRDVVLLPDFVWHTARPCLDPGKSALLLVVPRLADIHALTGRQPTGASFEETRHEHDKAPINDLLDGVVAVLRRLGDLVLIEVLVLVVHGLLGAVVPAGVDPALALGVLPEPEDLSNDGLGQIICVVDVNPVACTVIRFLLFFFFFMPWIRLVTYQLSRSHRCAVLRPTATCRRQLGKGYQAWLSPAVPASGLPSGGQWRSGEYRCRLR